MTKMSIGTKRKPLGKFNNTTLHTSYQLKEWLPNTRRSQTFRHHFAKDANCPLIDLFPDLRPDGSWDSFHQEEGFAQWCCPPPSFFSYLLAPSLASTGTSLGGGSGQSHRSSH
jgi:hypothetical protein